MKKPNALNNIRIVLSHTSHPGNIGAAARAMKTMGLERLYLVNPKSFPDPVADARAAGAVDVLENAQVCATLDEALAGTVLAVAVTARRRDLSHEMLSAHQVASRMLDLAVQGDVALLFGTEMSGLSNAELDKCQMLATIPANPEFTSLNLASAVQILVYELRMAYLGATETLPAKAMEAASFEDVERFYQHLEQTMVDTGFLDPACPGRLMQRLRRLFARARPEKEEVSILRGILTSVEKFTNNRKNP
ncbi:RNA methyltransferase TrmH [Sulfuricella denitrificans skB26]|uniref:tRNA (cytidine/uridine-2'-O-)-methyltransferase TrmJ n=1 Tax=Sulfuricella denitrificans (strain DSM 22764 / NBRC 105220 / skB26) TaxID=1163617 RepID=S6AA17_SULDS|nr:tRNA (cytosine(32)/uridine(32)-2'-O)-methyltransferase TrmJ [Sulfuricella denitrificans]BAN35080.1 RNA methyltransferase TrmH [Sulfuricella denitrificans skB26]